MLYPSRRSTLIGFGLGLAGALAGTAAADAAPKRTAGGKSRTVTQTGPTYAEVRPFLRFGVVNAGGPLAGAELDKVRSLAGEAPQLVQFFKDFRQPPPIKELNAVHARGGMPILTWEPWAAGGGVNQRGYSLASIAGGAHDGYIKSWGAALASWGKPFMLRFAHEMNGDWYPWSEAVNGNRRGEYVRAWRRVHNILKAAGAVNARWVWAPNTDGPVELTGLYPGHSYVDILGLDGYNWGTSGTSWGSEWTAASHIFGPGLGKLRQLGAGKEIIITETASSELGGNKSAWIRDAIAYLDSQADVTGFVWFDLKKETDWRVASSRASSAAFAKALLARR